MSKNEAKESTLTRLIVYATDKKLIQKCCCPYFYVVRSYEKMKLAERDELIRQHVIRRRQYEADDALRKVIKNNSVVENDLSLSRTESESRV